ncbi:MAG TPA: carboxypeptidase-like regulatory domain-containing protein [Pyrinomonadaceae bacterium]|jgi:hypothetical protein
MKDKLNNLFKLTVTALLFALVLFFPIDAFAQTKETETPTEIVASGGSFTLEKTVTAGGGGAKRLSPMSETGTTGQTIAGIRSTGGQFAVYSGFWTPDTFAPTAANVVVGGRILTASGLGIRNVQVTITFPSGAMHTTLSSSFGYYRFADVPSGAIYVISVAAKKYTFAEATQIRQVMDDLQDVDFIADAN